MITNPRATSAYRAPSASPSKVSWRNSVTGRGSSLAVHPLDHLRELVGDRGPLHLLGRGQLPFLVIELDGEQLEALDPLHLREIAVDLLDDARDQLVHAFVGREVGVGRIRDALARRPVAYDVALDPDERAEEATLIADDNRLADERRYLEAVLGLRGGDVLAAGGDHDVFFSGGGPPGTVALPLPHVSRVQPAVGIDRRGRRLGILEVPGEDPRRPSQDLAVLGQPQLDPGQRAPDRAEPDV